jgi:hypothetical protein
MDSPVYELVSFKIASLTLEGPSLLLLICLCLYEVPQHNEPEVTHELQVIKADDGEPMLPQLQPDVTNKEVCRLLVEYMRAVYGMKTCDPFDW